MHYNFSLHMKIFLLFISIFCFRCVIIRKPAENKLPIQTSKKLHDKKTMDIPPGMCYIPGKSRIIGPTDEQFDNSRTLSNKSVTLTPFFIFETPIKIIDYKIYLKSFETYLTSLYNNVKDPQGQNKLSNTPGVSQKTSQPKNQPKSDQSKSSSVPNQKKISITISRKEFYNILEGRPQYKNKIKEKDFIEACKKKILPHQDAFVKGLKYQFEDKINHYNNNTIFDEYPAIFVNYHQAEWFLKYLTFTTNSYRKKHKKIPYPAFELPSVAQWEHAATDYEEVTPQRFSWGKNPKGKKEEKYANFKYLNHNNDLQPVYRSSAYRNSNGLYDMQGNVNEWTKDSFCPAMNATVSGLDPVYIDKSNPNKVIKGGSWNDPYVFQEISYNGCAHENFQSSTIGFRPIMRYYGDY